MRTFILLLCCTLSSTAPPQSSDLDLPGFVAPPATPAPPGGVAPHVLQSTPFKAQGELRAESGMLTPGHSVPPENASYGLFKYKCVGEIIAFSEGQIPEQIAAQYSIPWQIFRETNIPFFYQDSRDLKQGDKLCLPRIDWHKTRSIELSDEDKGTQPACLLNRTVVSGDTLHTIATANAISVDAILELNYLTSKDSLTIGQVICLPANASKTDSGDPKEAMDAPERFDLMVEPHPDAVQAQDWYHPGNTAAMESDAALTKMKEHEAILNKYKAELKEALNQVPAQNRPQLEKEAKDAPTVADTLQVAEKIALLAGKK